LIFQTDRVGGRSLARELSIIPSKPRVKFSASFLNPVGAGKFIYMFFQILTLAPTRLGKME